MATFTKFEEIEAWQKARILFKEMNRIINNTGLVKDFALRDQTRRSCGSIMDNIAEGFERGGNKEFIQFLFYSRGSTSEFRSQLYRILDCGYIDKPTFTKLYNDATTISKKVMGLILYLKRSNLRGAKFNESETELTTNDQELNTNHELQTTNHEHLKEQC